MVSPVTDLMSSFKTIYENKRTFHDDDYIYVKDGSLHTEAATRRYTRSSLKAKTAERLLSVIRQHYSATVGDALEPLMQPYLSGEHQLKVGVVRSLFQQAEVLRLNEVSQALRQAYPQLGNPLEPLYQHVMAKNSLTTDLDVKEEVKRLVGHDAYAVALAGGLGVQRGDGLNQLHERLTEVMPVVKQFNASAPRVRDAVTAFCRGGQMTRAAALAVVNRQMPLTDKFRNDLNALLEKLPEEGVTVDDAFKFFAKANRFYKQVLIDEYVAQQPDPILCRMAGISRLRDNAAELTADEISDIQSKMADAEKKPNASFWLAAVRDVREAAKRDGIELSDEFDNYAAQLVKEHAKADVKADEEGKAAFKKTLEIRLKRETNYDFAMQYEIDRQPWNREQIALFRQTMGYVRDEMPREDFFVKLGCVANHLVTLINEGAADLSDPLSYLKACAMVGIHQAAFVREHLAEVSALYHRTNGRPTLAQLTALLYGANAAVPDKAKGFEAMWPVFEQHWEALCDQFYADGWEGVSLRGNGEALAFIGSATTAGMKLKSAVAHWKDPELPVVAEDFYEMPGVGLPCRKTAAEVEADFVRDFGRQKMPQGLLGNAKIILSRPDGTGMMVSNETETMTAAEKERFEGGQERCPRHEKVFEALRELTGDNEAQYVRLMEYVTQSGPSYGMKGFGRLVAGGMRSGLEHTPLQYHFSKNPEDGSVVLECHTPENLPIAKLRARYVFDVNGGVTCTDWRLDPFDPPVVDNSALADALVKNKLPENFKPARQRAYEAAKAKFGGTRVSLGVTAVMREAKLRLMEAVDCGDHVITEEEVQRAFEFEYALEMLDDKVNQLCMAKVQEKGWQLDPKVFGPRMVSAMVRNSLDVRQGLFSIQTPERMTALVNSVAASLDRELEDIKTLSDQIIEVKQAAMKELTERGGLAADVAEEFLQNMGPIEICPEMFEARCLDAAGHMTPEAMERAVKGMAGHLKARLADRLAMLEELNKLGLPAGPAKAGVQRSVLGKCGLKSMAIMKLVEDVAKGMDVSGVENALKATPSSAAAVAAPFKAMLEAANKRLMDGLTALRVGKVDQNAFSGLFGAVTAILLHQHPELAKLIEKQAGVFGAAGQQLTAGLAEQNDEVEQIRCFVLYFMNCPEPANMQHEYLNLRDSCALVRALRENQLADELAASLQARQNSLRARFDTDGRLPDNPLESTAWQIAKAEIAARVDAGNTVDEAAVVATYESAAMREVLKGALHPMAAAKAAAIGLAGEPNLEGLASSSVAAAALRRTVNWTQFAKVKQGLRPLVEAEVTVQQAAMAEAEKRFAQAGDAVRQPAGEKFREAMQRRYGELIVAAPRDAVSGEVTPAGVARLKTAMAQAAEDFLQNLEAVNQP